MNKKLKWFLIIPCAGIFLGLFFGFILELWALSSAIECAETGQNIPPWSLSLLNFTGRFRGPREYPPSLSISGMDFIAATDGSTLRIYEIDGLNILYINPRGNPPKSVEILAGPKGVLTLKYDGESRAVKWELVELISIFKDKSAPPLHE